MATKKEYKHHSATGRRAQQKSGTRRKTGYTIPKSGNNGINFKELQGLVRRYNDQRKRELKRYADSGLSEGELVRTGVVRPKIATARTLVKDVVNEEQLAFVLDEVANMVKVRKSNTRGDVYTSRWEKKTGTPPTRRDLLQLPPTKEERVRYRFMRLLEETTELSGSDIERIVGEYDMVKGTFKGGIMSLEELERFMVEERSLMSQLWEQYTETMGLGTTTSRTAVSKRMVKALKQRGIKVVI